MDVDPSLLLSECMWTCINGCGVACDVDVPSLLLSECMS